MDFFWDQFNQPSRHRYPTTARGVPVRPVPPRNAPTTVYPVSPRNAPTTKPAPSPKVVSIPVHFVGSEKKRSASAVKIQKVFRGYLVRKSVRKIASIRRDVDEVERTISRREAVDSIRRVPKERVRLNEALMALLFKLDSVRGVDSGVRDFRKAVIKKAIALQERVDDIASGNETVSVFEEEDGSESDVMEIEEQTPEIEENQNGIVAEEDVKEPKSLGIEEESPENENGTVVEEDEKKGNEKELPENEANQDDTVEETLEIEEQSEHQVHESGVEYDNQAYEAVRSPADPEIGADRGMAMEELSSSVDDEADAINYSNNSEKNCEREDEDCEKMDLSEYVMVDEKVGGDVSDTAEEIVKEHLEESVDTTPTVPLMNLSVEAAAIGGRVEDDKQQQQQQDRNTELLEKMMEDNKKMMEMMTQMFERNEVQTRMLNSLSQRVGQLEKAFVCDRLRRKKRQNGDGSGSPPDQKRCGKNK